MRLREPLDLGGVDRVAVDPSQVLQDDLAPERQHRVRDTRGPRRRSALGQGQCDRAGLQSVVRQRKADRPQAIAAERDFRGFAQFDDRRAVTVARHRKIRGNDRAERRFAGEELHAGFLGGKSGGKAGRAAVTAAGVVELAPGEELE